MSIVTDAATAAIPGIGWKSKLKLALRFAPYVAIAALLIYALILRESNTSLEGERDAARVERDQYKASDEANTKTIEAFSRRQIDNDAIARAVADALASNNRRTERTRQALREATNEPEVRDWANMPVPGSVQRALDGSDDVPDAAR